jgi:hypothetical protein
VANVKVDADIELVLNIILHKNADGPVIPIMVLEGEIIKGKARMAIMGNDRIIHKSQRFAFLLLIGQVADKFKNDLIVFFIRCIIKDPNVIRIFKLNIFLVPVYLGQFPFELEIPDYLPDRFEKLK